MTLIDKAEALEPCPFCGGEARKWQDPSHSAAWFIGCYDGDRDCFGSIHWAETEAEAIAAWNRRAALAPTDAAHVNETPKSEHDASNVLTAAQAREAHLREAAAAVRARYMGDNNREDMEVLRCEAAIIALIGDRP